MELEIRKVVTIFEETFIEGFKKADKPVRIAAALAVIKNGSLHKELEGVFPS
jgi:hypothetical protein